LEILFLEKCKCGRRLRSNTTKKNEISGVLLLLVLLRLRLCIYRQTWTGWDAVASAPLALNLKYV